MLKGIDPLLGPDLLAILRAMGHGDEIVVADANFPPVAAIATAASCAPTAAMPCAWSAIVSVLPLDDFVPAAAFRMAVVDRQDEVPPIARDFRRGAGSGRLQAGPIEALERFAFYERAKSAYAVVATGETRLYGNLILKKGVLRPDARLMRIDAHQHFWRMDRGDYGWLTPKDHPKIARDFSPAELAPLLAAGRIDKTVLVQAAPTEAETQFLLELAAATPFVAGVVGWVDFEAPDAAARIARLSANSRLVGLRPMIQDIADVEWMLRPELAPALDAMQRGDLCFDALVKPRHLPALAEFLDRYPDLAVVIDHGAKPDIAGSGLDMWATYIRHIAKSSKAFCKLSGLASEAGPGWSAATLKPYVDVLLESPSGRRG